MLALYRSLLRLYPRDYFHEYAGEMEWVFCQAQEEARGHTLKRRALFCAREISGALAGALRQRLFSVWGANLSRRFDMRPGFRFPRSTVLLMCVILAGVKLAIEKAKTVAEAGLRSGTVAFWHPLLFWLYPFAVVLVVVGAVWGILFALRRTGMHRLANVQTSPEHQ
jgi:hypothetical protein